MAVTEFNFLADGTWGPKIDRNRVRTYQITIEAITDSVNVSGPEVIATAGFPQQFVSTHPNDPFAWCVSVDPQQDVDDATYWRVVYGYSSEVPEFAKGMTDGGNQPEANQDDPLDRKPKIRLYTRMVKVPTFFDYNGKAIVNKAGVPFETFNRELPILIIDVRRNIPGFTFDSLNDIVGAVNSGTFRGWEARRVKCDLLELEPKFDKGFYWDAHAQLSVGRSAQIIDATASPGGSDGWWYDWKLNAGYETWNSVTNQLSPIILETGQKPSRPVPLNSTGTAKLNLRTGGDTPVWIAFRVCPDADFSQLNVLFA